VNKQPIGLQACQELRKATKDRAAVVPGNKQDTRYNMLAEELSELHRKQML